MADRCDPIGVDEIERLQQVDRSDPVDDSLELRVLSQVRVDDAMTEPDFARFADCLDVPFPAIDGVGRKDDESLVH